MIFTWFCLSLLALETLTVTKTSLYTIVTKALCTWTTFAESSIQFGLLIDSTTRVMLVVIILVSVCVNLYSLAYIEKKEHRLKFLTFLSLFTASMFILVTADNLLQLFIGWEGVGLCSYLLISFWNTRVETIKSALKAVLFNRFGDVALLIAIGLCWIEVNTIQISQLVVLNIPSMDYIVIFFLIGAVGKSAQIGLHMWLPDAMEGPTPVSALIHAATMVTAGIFLLIRFGPLFENTTDSAFWIVIIGVLTAFFAASTASTQYDLKRIIAYSTCSQLGYMLTSCGCQAYSSALFHLETHAFFKALLFLSAGLIIHGLGGEQDLRKMSGILNFLPLSCFLLLIGALALTGTQPLAGSYSKHNIIEMVTASPYGGFSMFGLLTVSFITIAYTFRNFLMVHGQMTVFGYSYPTQPVVSVTKKNLINIHETRDWKFILPVTCLSLFSLYVGRFEEVFMHNLSLMTYAKTEYTGSHTHFTDIINDMEYNLIPFISTGFLIRVGLLFTLLFMIKLGVRRQFLQRKGLYFGLHRFLIKKWGWDLITYFVTNKTYSITFYFLDIVQNSIIRIEQTVASVLRGNEVKKLLILTPVLFTISSLIFVIII